MRVIKPSYRFLRLLELYQACRNCLLSSLCCFTRSNTSRIQFFRFPPKFNIKCRWDHINN